MLRIQEQVQEDENYADFIVFYLNRPELLKRYENSTITYINESFAVVHVPVSQISMNMISTYGYAAVPMLFGLTSTVSVKKSGIEQLRAMPNFNLRGTGVLIGIIDTGIDYTNPVFLKPDGTTKITSIWDQTITKEVPSEEPPYGTEYTSDQINQALSSANPYDIVPSRDDNGHGTMMAGIAVGNENPEENFAGVAPDAELVIVKLRQAKQYLRKFFAIPDDVTCFQENQIMCGVQYCVKMARKANKPIVICTGLGSSQGSHEGNSYLSRFMSTVADFPNTVVVNSVGNEVTLRRHFYSTIDPALEYTTVELNVSEKDIGFSMELWGDAPGIYTIDITSPNGEFIPKLAPRLRVNQKISFVLDTTVIYIDNLIAEPQTGQQMILLRFYNVSPGIWKFNVYGHSNLSTGFHIWLPMGEMISDTTYFLNPDLYTTVLAPGTSTIPISVTAYNAVNNNLFLKASRGYTKNNIIKPELAAPGVDYVAPSLNHEFDTFSGTGVAAAHTAGIAAFILEWAVVKGNQPGLTTLDVKNYLIRGAQRDNNVVYPNKDWGYGKIDVYNAFNIFRSMFEA